MGLFSKPKKHLKKLVSEGEYYEALEFGKSLEDKYSNDADFLFIMGSIFYILVDAKNALRYFDRGLKINPEDTEALLLKANVHLTLKEKGKVVECCEKILNVDSHHKGANAIMDKLASE